MVRTVPLWHREAVLFALKNENEYLCESQNAAISHEHQATQHSADKMYLQLKKTKKLSRFNKNSTMLIREAVNINRTADRVPPSCGLITPDALSPCLFT